MNSIPQNILSVPSNDTSEFKIPNISLKYLELKNFCHFDHIVVDFSASNGHLVEPLICLTGPNGCGKTTILSAIQMLFYKFNRYDERRYRSFFTKYVRNFRKLTPNELDKQDLMIKGKFLILNNKNDEEYDVVITRQNKIVKFHPECVFNFLPYFCFNARFDQELDVFQLKRVQWDKFKKLFESITGYEINEDVTLFDQSSDTRLNNLIKDYVLGFNVKKDNDIIGHKQCSAGEKKIIKTFSTILNKTVIPKIILIDNALMHVESERHLPMVQAIEDCFVGSQIILTCHSDPIRRGFPDGQKIIDMRCLQLENQNDFWKIRYIDELTEMKEKLDACSASLVRQQQQKSHLIGGIQSLICELNNNKNIDSEFVCKKFLFFSERAMLIIGENIKNIYSPRIKNIP